MSAETRRSYEELRDSLIKLQTEQAAIKKNNESLCEKIKTECSYLSTMDGNIAEMHGIDLQFLQLIDLTRLTTDEEYYQSVKNRLDEEAEKLYRVLENALKIN